MFMLMYMEDGVCMFWSFGFPHLLLLNSHVGVEEEYMAFLAIKALAGIRTQGPGIS